MLHSLGRTSSAVVASGALHVLVAMCDKPAPPSQREARALATMRFEVVSTAPLEPPAPSVVPAPPTAEPTKAKSKPKVRTSSPAVARDATRAAPAEAAPGPEPTPAQGAPAPSTSSATSSSRDLSPLAAARTLHSPQEAPWKVAQGDREAEREVDRAHEAALAHAIPELSREGQDREAGVHLAQDATWAIAKPWDLILQPLRRARYRYRGVGFDAIVRADGSVEYRSHAGVQVLGGQGKNIDGEPVPTYGIGFRDAPLTRLWGRDAHAAERRRFLERTRALRELLHERSVRVALTRADEHLNTQLGRVAHELDLGQIAAAHEALFALWDECSEDEVGARARKRIETFAREQCDPRGGQGFTEAELAALNRRRASKRLFAPYAALDAGATAAPDGSPDSQPPVLPGEVGGAKLP